MDAPNPFADAYRHMFGEPIPDPKPDRRDSRTIEREDRMIERYKSLTEEI